MANNVATHEEQLLLLTKEMLATAESKDWERLAELEKIRQPLFYDVFATVSASNASLAREVLSIDKKVMDMAETAKPILQEQLQGLMSSGKAKDAYQAVQQITPIEK